MPLPFAGGTRGGESAFQCYCLTSPVCPYSLSRRLPSSALRASPHRCADGAPAPSSGAGGSPEHPALPARAAASATAEATSAEATSAEATSAPASTAPR